jgi:glutamine cyclotransferase
MGARALLLAAALALGLPLCVQAEVPVQGYEVVRTYPHDPEAFTQGLIWRNGHLIETTGRQPSVLRRVRLEDGKPVAQRALAPIYFGEGVTELNGKLYSLTWRNGVGFVWTADDFTPLGGFTYAGEGWGLTTDGRRLIMSDGTPFLRFIDPDTMAETARVRVTADGKPVPMLNELEWIDGEVWANIWQSDRIARIDPETGVVTAFVELNGLLPAGSIRDPADEVLNGIAWDAEGKRLFVTGKRWPSLFEIRVRP